MPARRPPRHDHDAGGDPSLLDAKAALRDEVWTALRDARAARFPGAFGRIPNVVGAEAAAERLRQTEQWRRASTIKSNPDAPQWPVRQRALEDSKRVFMAVPRLAGRDPFLLLDPATLTVRPRAASSIKGATDHARPVPVSALDPVDLVVTGCVAVDPTGARLGKGGGFSDLEFAIATEAGLIDDDTVVVTTVHELQVLDPGRIPMSGHDVPLELIVTPERIIECSRSRPRASGIAWDDLTPEKIAAIPLLGELRKRATRARPRRR
ncbi:MAG TPA: 5-formyltetrahydrofolate cyclo-ligase [Acidimicrobiales bacterium]|nr:5-formyltetrahydrofolate cyclo-ligase [Acidimicrobiales bacterium]